jgi:exodeoxyribonuclease VII small subunit
MTGMSFEKALTDLESIVQKLEKGGLSLNESLALFEKGVKLAKFLREELGKAEKKVEVLLKNEKGDVRKEPFNLDREVGYSSPQEKGDKEEEEDGEEEETPF